MIVLLCIYVYILCGIITATWITFRIEDSRQNHVWTFGVLIWPIIVTIFFLSWILKYDNPLLIDELEGEGEEDE